MKKIKFTIVTVCFNSEKVIEETIKSVVSQRNCNIEYIVIDGNSRDGTADIINRYSDKIDYFVSEPDNGIYDAMNKGIAAATGDYINFMNAGDIFVNDNVLSDLQNMIHAKDYDVVFGDEIKCYSWGEVLQPGRHFSKDIKGMPFGHQSTFVKTALMKEFRFDTSYRILADQKFMTSLYKKGKIFFHVELAVAKYDMYGLSNNTKLIYREWARINGVTGFPFLIGYSKARIKSFVYRMLPQRIFTRLQEFRYRRQQI